ncbi:DUF2326 domain-containing protein [Hymenobacter sp.]|uniref:DUF2326 domain-containing protein n=1 Tax=Hymenobacter sp. TaxID=1898978 RepID=UPI00286B82EC|nr:DUF2326 domain-containing protein [Hymenobacter sp.]
MKISKLYCNKPFKNIAFNLKRGEINLILANVKARHEQRDTHNLGKSTLVDLIDFLLLKNIDKSHWLINTKKGEATIFLDYEFYLEILLNSGGFLTIKRTVNAPTKIFFKRHQHSFDDFPLIENWDYLEIPIEKAQALLNDLLNFDFSKLTGYSYRKSINYCLRGQGDYDNIFQLKKFSRSKDRDWKPFMFSLLGFKGDVLSRKYDLEEAIKEQSKAIKDKERDLNISSNDKDKTVGQIQLKTQEINKLSTDLDDFNFFIKDQETISTLVEEIENNISELNNKLYRIEFDINKLRKSIRDEFAFDINKVNELFNEVNVLFPAEFLRSYEELSDFNKKITTERNREIKRTLSEKEIEQSEIIKKLQVLNERKVKYTHLIHDTSIFKKYKAYQQDMLKAESELMYLKAKLIAFDFIEERVREISLLKENELKETKVEIETELSNTLSNDKYSAIRSTFSEIIHDILQVPAIISISKNNADNIEFAYSIENSAQQRGYTYNKLLCVAFDLSILINYASQSYFKFVYHDDAFGNEDNRLKIRLMSTIKRLCLKYDIQYIFTAIQDDLPNAKDLILAKDEIVLELNDKDDNGKLFLMSF